MIGETRKHHRLQYWKKHDLEPWATFDLVPVQTIEPSHAFFDKIVELVKASGFKYQLIEVSETIKDER